MNKMCLEFDFTYDMQISSRSVNPLSYYMYMKTIIVIISKNKSKNYREQNVLRIQFHICCTNFIRIGEQISDVIVTSRDVIIENFIENDRVYRKNKI